MLRGRSIKELEDKDCSHQKAVWTPFCFHPGGLFPIEKPEVKVIAPSVFHHWVSRQVAPEELAQIMDLPKEVYSVFRDPSLETLQKLGITTATPVKVLVAFSQSLLRSA